MNNIMYSFLISSIAGFSTIIGTIIIFFFIKNDNSVGYFLSLSSGVMISLSIIELIPKAISFSNRYYNLLPSLVLILLFIMIGMLITYLLDNIVFTNKNALFRTGIFSMLVITLHNVPEGIATFLSCISDIKFGIILSFVITIHNIPEGISIAVPIYYSTKSRVKALLYTSIAGFSELLGAFIAYAFFSSSILEIQYSYLFSIISGMMIYISIYEILPMAKKYSEKSIYRPFIIGIIVVILQHIIFE